MLLKRVLQVSSLKGKVALITGASSGIGAGTSVLFAKFGALLALNGRDEENLKKVAQQCAECGAVQVSRADHTCVTTTGRLTFKITRQRCDVAI